VSPLRRTIHIPIYWVVIGLMVMVVSPMLAIQASVNISERAIEKNEQSRREQSAQFQVIYCRLIGSQVDVYSEAQSEVGRNAHDTWLAEYQRSGCQPPRK